MASRYQILETLINSTKQVFNLQITRLDDLISKDYPYNSSKQHIRLLHTIYSSTISIINELEERFRNASTDKDYQKIETELKEISQTFTWLGGIATKIILSSTRENVSQDTVPLIKYLTGPFKEKYNFILFPTDDHNYEITRWGDLLQLVINEYKIKIDSLKFRPPTSFSILSFPAIYKDNLIAHSLLGHEIGHFIIWRNNLANEIDNVISLDKSIQKVIDSEIDSQITKQGKNISGKERMNAIYEIEKEIRSNISYGAEELLCDLIGFRIMGPVLLFASTEFFLSDTFSYQTFQKYPPIALRLQMLIDEIKKGGYIEKIDDSKYRVEVQNLIDETYRYITPEDISEYSPRELLQYDTWKKMIPGLQKIADKIIGEFKDLEYSADRFGKDMVPLLHRLMRLIPPCEIEQGKAAHVISILNAGMIFRLRWRKMLLDLPLEIKSKIESKLDAVVIRSVQQSEIESELQKALNNEEMSAVEDEITRIGSPSKEELVKRLKDLEEAGLVVTPLVFPKDQIKQAAIDVRLGNEFIITKRIRFDTLDPKKDPEELETIIKQYQEKIYVEFGQKIVLHPNQFVLGSTLEHIKLPADYLAYVVGRSSWGRLGLVIATATVINPKYSGAVTLELSNIGDSPITLYPGSRIAQLVFHRVDESKIEAEESKYELSVGPEFSKIYKDKEWKAFRPN